MERVQVDGAVVAYACLADHVWGVAPDYAQCLMDAIMSRRQIARGYRAADAVN